MKISFLISFLILIQTSFAFKVSVKFDRDPVMATKVEKNAQQLLDQFQNSFQKASSFSLKKSRFVSRKSRKHIASLYQGSPMKARGNSYESDLIVKSVNQEFQLRNIPVVVLTGGKRVQENIAIDFNRNGLIVDVKITIPEHDYSQNLGSENTVSDIRERQVIMDFVENFRTAYNRKDISYLQQVFNDKALIITGRVLKSVPGQETLKPAGVELKTQTKQEYLKKLSRVFTKNEYIKVGFDDIKIVRNSKYDKWYGVHLTQNFASSSYSDVGHVFLLIDMKKPEAPEIWVRAWQPVKETPEEEVIDIGYFSFE